MGLLGVERPASDRHGDVRERHHHIAPPSTWSELSLTELWSFRDLFGILATRDLKLRYRQTALGVIWVVLQPLLTSLIFAAVFGAFAKLPSDGAPYIVFVYAAMLPWNLFSGSLQRAGNSLVQDARLISKVYFPRIVIPIASASAVLVDYAVAALVLVGIELAVGWHLGPTWIAILPLTVVAVAVALGVSLFFSALNVYYRDFMYALPFVIQVWMYASPVVYSSSLVPARFWLVYHLNPMAGIVEGYRWAIVGDQDFPGSALALSVVGAVIAGAIGIYVFQRVERSFADVI